MSAAKASGKRKMSGDQKLLLILSGIMLVLITGISVLSPQPAQDDPKPSTYNRGPQGLKAAYLTLQSLGYTTTRWTRPLSELTNVEAAHTTLVLADPAYDPTTRHDLSMQLNKFLERGGHVLVTGSSGASLLLNDATRPPSILQSGLCNTIPEGPGALARAGRVELSEHVQWALDNPKFIVEQRCVQDAVVVRYSVGKGEAVWWTSATPMDNAELKQDADLRLLLASVGNGREILFDEAMHGVTRSIWDAAKGLPLAWLAVQAALLFLLLVLSFSRRRGPIRMPVALPRSSPVEFAESMGDLYAKGGATSAATEAARRSLLRVLVREAGLSQAVVQRGSAEIAEALQQRLGGDWSLLAQHLEDVQAARDGIAPRSALALVRALSEDREAVRAKLATRTESLASTVGAGLSTR
jgi:hypothetical protein